MNKDFTLYSEALVLKELGFDEPCFGHYQQEWHDDGITQLEASLQMIVSKQHQHAFQLCSAPTYSQAFRFFREKYGLSGWVNESFIAEARVGVVSIKSEIGLKYYSTTTKFFDNYEEAELACLRKLIEIVKSKSI